MRTDPPAEPGPEPGEGGPGGGEPVVVVPDDASSLQRDVEALRRERRALARRSRVRRMVTGRTGAGVGAPLVAGVLLAVGLFAALPVVLRPDLADDPVARPLAAPAAAPGTVGGLLPDIEVTTPAGTQRLRDTARPGVVMVLRADCGCDDDVVDALGQAREYTRNVRLVVSGDGAQEEADRLRRGATRGLVRSAVDREAVLARAYGARGLTLLVLAADGVVRDVLVDVRAGQRNEQRLRALLGPA